MNKKIESRHDELQPELTRPVDRQVTGTMFNVQPVGGVDSAIPHFIPMVLLFAPDNDE
jgi:hypothetical protein